MIKFFTSIVQNIIIAMIFITIIEMLLPNNSNKKYVKMVAGIYIIFVIINPFLKLINKDIDFSSLEAIESIETSSDLANENLKKYYIDSFKIAIKNSLEEQGYSFKEVKVELSQDYSEISSIKIIGANLDDLGKIQDFLVNNYGILRNNIIFG